MAQRRSRPVGAPAAGILTLLAVLLGCAGSLSRARVAQEAFSERVVTPIPQQATVKKKRKAKT